MENIVDTFLNALKKETPLFYPAIKRARERNPNVFNPLAGNMLSWAKNYLGDEWDQILIKGYRFFVSEVNRAQMQYEKDMKRIKVIDIVITIMLMRLFTRMNK